DPGSTCCSPRRNPARISHTGAGDGSVVAVTPDFPLAHAGIFAHCHDTESLAFRRWYAPRGLFEAIGALLTSLVQSCAPEANGVKRLECLDGLRGVLALYVLLSHMVP